MTSSRVGGPEHRGRPVDRRAQQDHQPADVAERQRAQPALAPVVPERDGAAERVVEDLAEREDDRPRRPGRAGGVDDEGRPGEVGRDRGQGRRGGRASGSSITIVAPARRGFGSRRSSGTAAAPASRQACSATAKSRPGGSAIATREAPRRDSAPARATAIAVIQRAVVDLNGRTAARALNQCTTLRLRSRDGRHVRSGDRRALAAVEAAGARAAADAPSSARSQRRERAVDRELRTASATGSRRRQDEAHRLAGTLRASAKSGPEARERRPRARAATSAPAPSSGDRRRASTASC